jgi:hypothetical protein
MSKSVLVGMKCFSLSCPYFTISSPGSFIFILEAATMVVLPSPGDIFQYYCYPLSKSE